MSQDEVSGYWRGDEPSRLMKRCCSLGGAGPTSVASLSPEHLIIC
ncbi:MAG: hypothetical protein OJF49_003279 [Ktedonobacterales bacterium]|nr:MAG: hypothetical protein OJF49_003279 [Ktedonobacterales bacterium]